jgi:hypothetical protein
MKTKFTPTNPYAGLFKRTKIYSDERIETHTKVCELLFDNLGTERFNQVLSSFKDLFDSEKNPNATKNLKALDELNVHGYSILHDIVHIGPDKIRKKLDGLPATTTPEARKEIEDKSFEHLIVMFNCVDGLLNDKQKKTLAEKSAQDPNTSNVFSLLDHAVASKNNKLFEIVNNFLSKNAETIEVNSNILSRAAMTGNPAIFGEIISLFREAGDDLKLLNCHDSKFEGDLKFYFKITEEENILNSAGRSNNFAVVELAVNFIKELQKEGKTDRNTLATLLFQKNINGYLPLSDHKRPEEIPGDRVRINNLLDSERSIIKRRDSTSESKSVEEEQDHKRGVKRQMDDLTDKRPQKRGRFGDTRTHDRGTDRALSPMSLEITSFLSLRQTPVIRQSYVERYNESDPLDRERARDRETDKARYASARDERYASKEDRHTSRSESLRSPAFYPSRGHAAPHESSSRW